MSARKPDYTGELHNIVVARLPGEFPDPLTGDCVQNAQQKVEPGVRHDAGKPRYDLLPPDAMADLVAVYTAGVEEYGARNWEKGMSWGRVVGSLLRHTFAWMRGEDLDPKSGLPHMAHAAWNALTLCAYFRRSAGTDDRSLG